MPSEVYSASVLSYLINVSNDLIKCYQESVEENGKLSMESFGYSAQLSLLKSILKDLFDYDLSLEGIIC